MKEADALKFQKKLNEEPFCERKLPIISKEQALKEQTRKRWVTDPAEFLGYILLQLLLKIKLNADYAIRTAFLG